MCLIGNVRNFGDIIHGIYGRHFSMQIMFEFVLVDRLKRNVGVYFLVISEAP